MTQVTQYSRQSLYDQYKKTDPALAKKFLEREFSLLGRAGVSCVAVATIFAIIFISIAEAWTHDLIFFAAAGSIIYGPFAAAGLVMLAIWYCKRRHFLTEKLTIQQINSIAGKVLIDSRTTKL